MSLGCRGFNANWYSVLSVFIMMHIVLTSRCCLIDSMLVSLCKCGVFVSYTSVAIRSAVFCMVCSLSVFVSDMMDNQIILFTCLVYTSDIATPPNNRIKFITYADDIMILSTHTNINIAKLQVFSYLQDIFNWSKQNNLILNPSKHKQCYLHHTQQSTQQIETNYKQHITPHGQKHKNTRSNIQP